MACKIIARTDDWLIVNDKLTNELILSTRLHRDMCIKELTIRLKIEFNKDIDNCSIKVKRGN